MAENEVPTISIAVSPLTRERIKYIQQQLGMKSRSSAVTVAINELYGKLVDRAHKNRTMMKELEV